MIRYIYAITSSLYPFVLAISLLSLLSSPLVTAMSPSDAAEKAQLKTGGKVLKVKLTEYKGYRVKVLMPNGQVRSIIVTPEADEAPETPNVSEEKPQTQ